MDKRLIEMLFESATDMVCLMATSGELIRVSRSWGAQLGWSETSLKGCSLIDLVQKDDPWSDILDMKQLHYHNRRTVRLRIRDSKGRFQDVEWSSLPIAKEIILAFGRIATADNSIGEEGLGPEIRLVRAIDNIPVAIALYDEADRLVISNRQFEATFSVAQTPMVPGTRFKDLVTAFAMHHGIGDQEEEAVQWIAQRLGRRHAPAEKLQFQYGGGRWAEVDDFLLPEGQIITVAVDISERKRAENDLRHRDRELRQLQAELTRAARLTAMAHLSSVLGHELSQPLTAIGNYTQAARRRLQSLSDPCVEDLAYLLDETSEQSKRAAAILTGLKDLARSGHTIRSREDLSADVEMAAALVISGTADEDIEINLQLAEDLPEVNMNRVQVQQVVVNLLRNAIEAMADSSRVSVTLATTQAGPDHVEVAVADCGPGLSEEVRTRLFKPFTTTKPDGAGLGLSICHSIIEAHGGEIWAEENPSGGTCFRFKLPLNPKGAEEDVS